MRRDPVHQRRSEEAKGLRYSPDVFLGGMEKVASRKIWGCTRPRFYSLCRRTSQRASGYQTCTSHRRWQKLPPHVLEPRRRHQRGGLPEDEGSVNPAVFSWRCGGSVWDNRRPSQQPTYAEQGEASTLRLVRPGRSPVVPANPTKVQMKPACC